MKRFLITMIITCGLFMTGCSYYETETSETSVENINGQIGRFIILESEGTYLDKNSMEHTQYLVYDKDTYIIYIYDVYNGYYRGGASISPYYCMNADNEPEIAVYWDGMEE